MSERVKVFKITLCIVDLDGIGADEIRSVLENAQYPNDCIGILSVEGCKARSVKWTDGHPLNSGRTAPAAFRALFGAEDE